MTTNHERMEELVALARADDGYFWQGLLGIAKRDVETLRAELRDAPLDAPYEELARMARQLAAAAELLAGEGVER